MRTRNGFWRWIGRGLVRLFVWAAAVAAMVYVAGAWYLPGVVERALAGRFPEGAVSVEGARFSGAGVLIKGVAVAEDAGSLAVSPIVLVERVRLGFALDALLRRRVSVRSVRVQDAVVTAEFEAGRGWNVSRLGFAGGGDGGAGGLPVVWIERGAIRVRRIGEGRIESIATVGVDGQIVPAKEAGVYAFLLRADDRLALSGSRVEGTLRVGGAGQASVLSLTGTVRMPRTPILGNAWNLDDVTLACVFDGEGVAIERLGFRMGDGVGAVSGRLGFTRDGAFDVSALLTGFSISDTAAVNTAVYSDSAMELLGPWAARFLRRYRPQGAGDVDLRVQGRWDALAQTAVTGTVVCRDISIVDARFPYRLSAMQGPIVFSGRSLRLESLSCRHGASEFVIEGSIADFGRDAEIRLRVVSGKIRFDEDVYRALGPESKRMWFAFSPSGTGAIDHVYHRFPDGRKTQRLTVELIDAGAIYEHFPYPLEHLTGRLIFEPNTVRLDHLASHFADGRSVRLDGSVSGPDDFSLRVRATAIPVDALLIGAMPQAQQDMLSSFELEGSATVDLEVSADVTGQRPFDYTAHLEVSGRRLVYAGFAVPLEDVAIAADISQDAIALRTFTGRYGDGRVSLQGQIAAAGEDGTRPGLCLAVEATGFELDAGFWSAAEREVSSLPEGFRLGGAVDVRGRWRRNMAAACEPMDVTVECRGNPVMIDGRTAAHVSGRVQFAENRVRLEDFRVDSLVLDESLAEVMPTRLKEMYQRLGVVGRMDAELVRAELMLDEHGFGGAEVVGRVVVNDVTSETTEVIDHLDGMIEGMLRLDAAGRVQAVEAAYQAEGFEVRGRGVDRLFGPLVFDPNEGVLVSRNFTAELGDGTATGTLTVDIVNETSPLSYGLDMNFAGIGVEHFTAAAESSAESPSEQRGRAAGTVTIRGRLGQSGSHEGRVSVGVTTMRMGKQSLMGKMLTAIQFREPTDYVFDRMEIETFLRGQTVLIDRIRISGRPFVFHGDGRFDLATNRIEMDLFALGGAMGVEPILLDSLLRGLGAAFWKIEVRGDLREPEIRTISLPILQLPLELLRR